MRHFPIAIGWTIIVFIAYGMHANDIPKVGFSGIDKAVHVVLFTLLVHLWCVALRKQSINDKWRQKALSRVFLLSLVLGFLLELFQGIIFASRTTEVLDIAANFLGSCLGIVLFRLIYGKDLTRMN